MNAWFPRPLSSSRVVLYVYKSRSLKKKRKKAKKIGKIFFFLNYMTRQPHCIEYDYRHLLYTQNKRSSFDHQKTVRTRIIYSLCLHECFYFFARREIGSVFSTLFSAPRILELHGLDFPFSSPGAFDRFSHFNPLFPIVVSSSTRTQREHERR